MSHDIFGLGVPSPSGNENDTYVTDDCEKQWPESRADECRRSFSLSS